MILTEVPLKPMFPEDENSLEFKKDYEVNEYHVNTKYANFRFQLISYSGSYVLFPEELYVGVYPLSLCCDDWVSKAGYCKSCQARVQTAPIVSLSDSDLEIMDWCWSLSEIHQSLPINGLEAYLAPLELFDELMELKELVTELVGVNR